MGQKTFPRVALPRSAAPVRPSPHQPLPGRYHITSHHARPPGLPTSRRKDYAYDLKDCFDGKLEPADVFATRHIACKTRKQKAASVSSGSTMTWTGWCWQEKDQTIHNADSSANIKTYHIQSGLHHRNTGAHHKHFEPLAHISASSKVLYLHLLTVNPTLPHQTPRQERRDESIYGFI